MSLTCPTPDFVTISYINMILQLPRLQVFKYFILEYTIHRLLPYLLLNVYNIMKNCLVCKNEDCACYKDLGILLIRLVLGAVFIYHGWAKVGNIDGTLAFFTQIGLGNLTLVYLAAYGELIGGILLVLGLWTRYVTPVLVIIMAVAIQTVHLKAGFNIMQGGYEYALTLLVVSAGLGMIGAGKYSVDANMGKKISGKK
jgi:putative oxidoreductase